MKNTKWTTEKFIHACVVKFGNRFDYTKVSINGIRCKIKLTCLICMSEFEIGASHHLRRGGCRSCWIKSLMMSFDSFLIRANQVHNDIYRYNRDTFKDTSSKIEIECPIHGIFWQLVSNHLQGQGCKKCATVGTTTRSEVIIEKFRKVHGDLYDYSKVEHKAYTKKVEIICRIHGSFDQTTGNHLNGQGCPGCRVDKISKQNTKTHTKFLEDMQRVHGEKYDFCLSRYKSAKEKVIVICKKHGKFLSTPDTLRVGGGCIWCKSSRGEERVRRLLERKGYEFEGQKTFPSCYMGKVLPFDFYIPTLNCLIEYDGIQHFPDEITTKQKIGMFQNRFQLLLDMIKTDWCKDNGIPLLRIKYDDPLNEKLEEFLDKLNNLEFERWYHEKKVLQSLE